jgi:hypothetical protein
MPVPEDPSDRNCACQGKNNNLATTFQYNVSRCVSLADVIKIGFLLRHYITAKMLR